MHFDSQNSMGKTFGAAIIASEPRSYRIMSEGSVERDAGLDRYLEKPEGPP